MPKISEKMLLTFQRGLACSKGGMPPSLPLASHLFRATHFFLWRLKSGKDVRIIGLVVVVIQSYDTLETRLETDSSMWLLMEDCKETTTV